MILRNLLENVRDQESLVKLLQTREDQGGLGWPVDTDLPFQLEPEIAADVKGDGLVTVSRLIPASTEDPHLVLLAEFEQPYVRRDLRELLSSVRRHIRNTGRFEDHTGMGDTLFLVVAPEYSDVRFVLFEERERRLPRIRSFGWDREFIGRTVLTHNLGRLLWSERPHWERAWDVEGLTDEFYNEFVKVFDAVKAVTTHPGTEENRNAYVQQLLNRLLFIAFIERMKWLKTPEGDSDYLHAQWLRFQRPDRYQEVEDKTLIPATFNGLLGWLFFHALDAPSGVKQGDRLYPLLGEVPYLNGGLFSEEADLDVSGVTVADEAFDLLLGDRRPGFEGGLFRRFNFTVTESTPLDQEVAVDPEMLGKIFERIIIAEERHRSGTYYTPRPIVEYMVNEALKGYLIERGLPADKATMLVDNDTVESESLSFRPSEMQETLDRLFEVRAVDPACGSGAYLLMLLQRLFELVDRLEVVQHKRRNPNQRLLYETKLRLLEHCVYGVDKSEIAVRIARLRLWLSLVVENKGEKPEPLPSFDFLIMCGDTLASPVQPDQHSLGYPHDAISEYTRMKRRYFHPAGGRRPTREQMAKKRAEIGQFFADEMASNPLRSLAKAPFDWEVEFAEVFDPQDSEETLGGHLNLDLSVGRRGQQELPTASARLPGFDIVLANPPFVNSRELLKAVGAPYKKSLIAAFPNTFNGTADLLICFFDRALQLLRPGGQLVFITSDKWLKATYGQKLRCYLGRTCNVHALIDFHDLPVFQNVIAYPLITLLTKEPKQGRVRYVSVLSLDAPYPDVSALVADTGVELPASALNPDGNWRLESSEVSARTNRMRTRGIPLGEYIKGRCYRGVLTGLNEVKIGDNGQMYGKTVPEGVKVARREGVFIIDGAKRAELIEEDEKSAEIIRPLAVGKDIRRWAIENNDRWLILTKIGIEMSRYPAIQRHLEKYKEKLIPRADQGNHWWELRACAYYDEFEKPKIVYPDMGGEIRGALSPAGQYFGNTAYMIASNDLYLLGVLNSEAFHAQLGGLLNANLNDTKRAFTDRMVQTIIPLASDSEKTAIATFVERILAAKASNPDADVATLEAELNRRVEHLYFGDAAEQTYEEAMARERGEIRNLLRRPAEDATLEFKETLWWDVKQERFENDRVLDVAKAICAMINRDGGTILIGVADEGNRPVGIARDLAKLNTPDGFQRKIAEPFGQKLSPDPSDLVRVRFVDLDGVKICRVDVKPDRTTMYQLSGKVYVRRDGESREMSGTNLAHWWVRRQKGEE